MPLKRFYYAVKRGRKRGIFRSWEECKKHVLSYSGARYKKFLTEAEAINFCSSNGPLRNSRAAISTVKKSKPKKRNVRPSLVNDDRVFMPDTMLFYSDGSCLGNTNVASVRHPAGWAFVLLLPDFENQKMRLKYQRYNKLTVRNKSEYISGKNLDEILLAEVTSNNTAELMAIGEIFKFVLYNEMKNTLCSDHKFTKILVRTDSKYAQKSILKIYNGNKNTKLIHDIRNLKEKIEKTGMCVQIDYVRGHSIDQYNNLADQLANQACGVTYDEKAYSKLL